MPFSFQEIAKLNMPRVDRVPKRAQTAVSSVFANTAKLAATGSEKGWLKLLAFPNLILGKCPRGGSAAASTVAKRCHL